MKKEMYQIGVRFPVKMAEQIKKLAKDNSRSMSAQVRVMVEKALAGEVYDGR